MPFDTNVGRRTGVTTLRRLVLSLCKLYDAFKPSITSWLEGQLSEPQLTTVKTWLETLSDVCFILTGTPDD